MHALRELQRRFGAALRNGDTAAIEPFIRAAGIEPARRLAIYRNNRRENAAATLFAAYPVVARLVGADYFRQLVQEFLGEYPSPSGDLQHLGAPFPRFLQDRHGRSAYAYLEDVARLEWAYQEVLVAAEHPALDIRRLSRVPREKWPDLGFVLHPAVRLFRSRYPVLTIWSAHQPRPDGSGAAAIDDTTIDLELGGENVLLLRADSEVELHRLPPAEFALLEALARGSPLAAAADAAGVIEPAFDLSQVLQRHVGMAVLVDFTVPPAASQTDGD